MQAQAHSSSEELQNYLDPRVLSRIHKLDLRTRLIVEGFMSGLHRSPYHGQSIEFARHREYSPGDDTRRIDWKVYSKTDRFYVKQFEVETNVRCTFVVDASESMKYAGAARIGEGLTKFHYASCVAASLSLLLLHQQDAVGLVTFDEDIVNRLAPSSNPNQIKAIVHHLETAADSLKAKTSIGAVCRKISEQMEHRGMVCVISDLLVDDDGALMRGLIRLAHQGHDLMVLHVLDEEELTFPFDGNTRFVGMEETGDVVVQPRMLRDGYVEALNRFLLHIKRQCVSNRIDYALLSTAEPLGAVLSRFLARRIEHARKGGSKRR